MLIWFNIIYLWFIRDGLRVAENNISIALTCSVQLIQECVVTMIMTGFTSLATVAERFTQTNLIA